MDILLCGPDTLYTFNSRYRLAVLLDIPRDITDHLVIQHASLVRYQGAYASHVQEGLQGCAEWSLPEGKPLTQCSLDLTKFALYPNRPSSSPARLPFHCSPCFWNCSRLVEMEYWIHITPSRRSMNPLHTNRPWNALHVHLLGALPCRRHCRHQGQLVRAKGSREFTQVYRCCSKLTVSPTNVSIFST